LSFRPGIEFGDIDDDLSVGREFNLGAVHGARRRAFEVDAFAVVATAVARAFEFVFARLPVGGAAEVGAASVNDEKTIRRAIDPDAIFLLPLGINPKSVVGGVSNLEGSTRLEQCARQEEAEECEKPRDQKSGDAHPCQSTAAL